MKFNLKVLKLLEDEAYRKLAGLPLTSEEDWDKGLELCKPRELDFNAQFKKTYYK